MVIGELPSQVMVPLHRDREGLGRGERTEKDSECGEGKEVKKFRRHLLKSRQRESE